ncbi:MAG: hypothetical protein M1837_004256 [Sclerophora amabilis]|nr:MAG: hypothetical protein M1837_004256 [Sclerophora amabilis]
MNFALKLQIPFTPRQYDIRHKQPSRSHDSSLLPDASQQDLYYLRGASHHLKGYPNPIPEFRAFPPALLETFAVLVANEREMDLLDRFPGEDSTEPEEASGPAGWRNVFAVMSQLLMALRVKRNAIMAFGSSLAAKPSNPNQVNAKIYRDSQLDILRGIIMMLEDRIRKASVPREISTSGIPELVTLDLALKYLSQGGIKKRNLFEDFTNGLEAAFGTSSIPELREAGWEDAIWALWICTLKLWRQSREREVTHSETPSASSNGREAFHSSFSSSFGGMSPSSCSRVLFFVPNTLVDPSLFSGQQFDPESLSDIDRFSFLGKWIDFMSRADLYGDPLRDEPSIPAEPGDEDDLSAISQDLLPLVEEAAASKTSIMFGMKAWSSKLLRWGAKVMTEEGLRVHIDDDNPEVGSQYVLCFQTS